MLNIWFLHHKTLRQAFLDISFFSSPRIINFASTYFLKLKTNKSVKTYFHLKINHIQCKYNKTRLFKNSRRKINITFDIWNSLSVSMIHSTYKSWPEFVFRTGRWFVIYIIAINCILKRLARFWCINNFLRSECPLFTVVFWPG